MTHVVSLVISVGQIGEKSHGGFPEKKKTGVFPKLRPRKSWVVSHQKPTETSLGHWAPDDSEIVLGFWGRSLMKWLHIP